MAKKNLLEVLRGVKPQSAMALRYNVSQQTWSSWESGRTVPNHNMLLKMENDFGIPMEVIFFNIFNYKTELNERNEGNTNLNVMRRHRSIPQKANSYLHSRHGLRQGRT